jgi:hypothetical protein
MLNFNPGLSWYLSLSLSVTHLEIKEEWISASLELQKIGNVTKSPIPVTGSIEFANLEESLQEVVVLI